jgi:hypothetical protein
MLICPKCSKTFEDGSKICRDCGAILNPVEIPQQEETPTESVFADDEVEEELPESEWDQTPWQCPTCKESIEAGFDVCWHCGTNRAGKPDPVFVSERAGSEPMETEQLDRSQRKIPQGDPCPRCGSTQVIPNASIGDQGQHSDGKLKAEVVGNPDAWIFKDIERSELKADICGQCGHVELKVTNPGLLYEHYLRSVESTYE